MKESINAINMTLMTLVYCLIKLKLTDSYEERAEGKKSMFFNGQLRQDNCHWGRWLMDRVGVDD